MKHPALASALTTCFFLSACATNTTITVTPAEIRNKIQHAHVTVLPIAQPAPLTEKTKAQAVGNFIFSSVISSVVGSSGSASNPQQFQANVDIATSFGNELSKALPTSYSVASGKGADLALAKKISDYFAKSDPSSNPADQKLSIAVGAPLWELGYTSFLGSEDYALNYHIQVSVLEKSKDSTTPLKSVSCAAAAPEKMPLEQWQSNDYAALNASAQTIVDSCFKRFLTETGLADAAGLIHAIH